jgi:hypothetical protein
VARLSTKARFARLHSAHRPTLRTAVPGASITTVIEASGVDGEASDRRIESPPACCVWPCGVAAPRSFVSKSLNSRRWCGGGFNPPCKAALPPPRARGTTRRHSVGSCYGRPAGVSHDVTGPSPNRASHQRAMATTHKGDGTAGGVLGGSSKDFPNRSDSAAKRAATASKSVRPVTGGERRRAAPREGDHGYGCEGRVT